MVNGAADIAFYIQHRKEERYLKYKGAIVWTSDDTKVKIVQAMMAMSNLRNGGVIVVGMKEPQRGVWEPDIMTNEPVSLGALRSALLDYETSIVFPDELPPEQITDYSS